MIMNGSTYDHIFDLCKDSLHPKSKHNNPSNTDT